MRFRARSGNVSQQKYDAKPDRQSVEEVAAATVRVVTRAYIQAIQPA
jgi:hypothetical protein